MKNKILMDKRIRERDTVIIYYQISNKSSLIKNLNEKKINPLTIKIISNRDGNKIKKIKKMCQIIF